MPRSSITRREWLRHTAAGAVAALGAAVAPPDRLLASTAPAGQQFRLWVCADPHVGTDRWVTAKAQRTPRPGGRESLAEAIRQSESSQGFEWDIGLCLGDFSGNQGIPDDVEGQEVVRQFGALGKHRREQFYCLAGNHDASPENRWFRKWLDPLGENTQSSGVDRQRMPYPAEGTWERYAFRVGNLLFLMMGDRNEFCPPVGRIKDGKGLGGRPPGAVTVETFQWWQKMVDDNPDRVIVSAHHHMLCETTIASGPWEGTGREPPSGRRRDNFHGYFADDGPHNAGASYLYWLVDDTKDPPQATPDAHAFERYLAAHPGAIDFWLGGHTHAGPDEVVNGRTHVERKWDANFVNCAALTRYHVSRHSVPMSRLLTFTVGSPEVRVQCWLHTSEYAPQGWYAKAERIVRIGKPFAWNSR